MLRTMQTVSQAKCAVVDLGSVMRRHSRDEHFLNKPSTLCTRLEYILPKDPKFSVHTMIEV